MPGGTLVLVVGPSGSGKDTLINGARAVLGADGRFAFVRREITRASALAIETHIAVSEAEFKARRDAGLYALHWQAHGLHYGVPHSIGLALDGGRHIIVNVSRTIVEEARTRYERLRIVQVRVPDAALRMRLNTRARESDADVERRLARAAAYAPSGPDVVAFDNDAPVELSVSRFVALIESLVPLSA